MKGKDGNRPGWGELSAIGNCKEACQSSPMARPNANPTVARSAQSRWSRLDGLGDSSSRPAISSRNSARRRRSGQEPARSHLYQGVLPPESKHESKDFGRVTETAKSTPRSTLRCSSSEEAIKFVSQVALPQIRSPKSCQEYLCGTEGLVGILRHRIYASAIVAPITRDVLFNGKEVQSVNEVRGRMFATLQNRLELLTFRAAGASNLAPKDVVDTCRIELPPVAIQSTLVCISTALQASRYVEGDVCHCGGDIPDIDPVIVQKALLNILLPLSVDGSSTAEFRTEGLAMLREYLLRHPFLSPLFAPVFLFDSDDFLFTPTPNARRSSCDSVKTEATLLRIIGQFSGGEKACSEVLACLAIACVNLIVKSLPLSTWILECTDKSVRAPSSPIFNDPKLVALSVSLDDLSSSLAKLVSTVCDCFRRQWSVESSASLHAFVRFAALSIPYNLIDDTDELFKAGFNFFSLLAGELHRSQLVWADPDLDQFMETLSASVGGRPTPDGEESPAVKPFELFLRSSAGCLFVRDQLLRLNDRSVASVRRGVSFVKDLAYAVPGVILQVESSWEALRQCVSLLVGNPDSSLRALCFDLIAMAARGRKKLRLNSNSVDQTDFLAFVLPILSDVVGTVSTATSSKIAACKVYAALTESDWDELEHVGEARGRIESVVGLCCKSSQNSVGLREEACKCLGDVSSVFFDQHRLVRAVDSNAMHRYICNEIIRVLLKVLDEPGKLSVSALYALGNLMQTILPTTAELAEPAHFVPMAQKLMLLANSSDPKISTNALRTAIYTSRVYMRYDYGDSLGDKAAFSAHRFLDLVIGMLTVRIRSSWVSPSADGSTWQDRLAARKRGYGAANALHSLLSDCSWFQETDCTSLFPSLQDALESLLECIETLEVVHEKVAVSCASALQFVDTRTIVALRNMTPNFIGRVVKCCLLRKIEETEENDRSSDRRPSRILLVVSAVLQRYLKLCIVEDAAVVVQADGIGKTEIELLCRYMVTHDCPASCFFTFAEALSNASIALDPQLEWLFLVSSKAEVDGAQTGETDDEL
jgi:hypothetical protein